MMARLIDANFAQHIANVELSPDNAGIVQWVLSHTPTVDAELVIHGRLIETGWDEEYENYGRCSACGADNRMRNNYCGNCGAKMDGECR